MRDPEEQDSEELEYFEDEEQKLDVDYSLTFDQVVEKIYEDLSSKIFVGNLNDKESDDANENLTHIQNFVRVLLPKDCFFTQRMAKLKNPKTLP